MFKQKIIWIVALCASCILLGGCTKAVKLSAGEFPEDSQQLSIAATAEDFALLDSFPALQSVDFSGSELYEEILTWAQSHPQVDVSYTVKLPDGQLISHDAESLDLSGMDAGSLENALPMLSYLPSVTEIQLPAGLGVEQILSVSSANPQLTLAFKSSVLGIEIGPDTNVLNLEDINSADVQELTAWGPVLTQLEQIELGRERDDLSWDAVAALASAFPDALLEYDFTLYGKQFSLSDTQMDLNHITIEDEGALVKQITGCMRKLEYLDMDSCGVSDEAMAEIRDSLPNTKVVWRIWFGDRYSVRTDVEKILASNPGMGGELTSENTQSLKYCTKVKYLDVGHNSWLNDISFVSYMPDLEVAVLAMGNWSDISPLANCPKLEYAELQTSCLNDLRPLSQLKNLKHLNIAYCVALTDISPLYELTQLERLWIGKLTPISEEQVEKMQSIAPNCQINTTTLDPTEGSWRYVLEGAFFKAVPRYELLRDQFEYHLGTEAYSYYYNDPLY